MSFFPTENTTVVYIFGSTLDNFRWICTVSVLNISNDGTKVLGYNQSLTKMPEDRLGHCAVAFDDRYVFIIGGNPSSTYSRSSNTADKTLVTSYIFDSEKVTFVAIFNIARPRWNAACDIVNSTIVIAGGYRQGGVRLQLVSLTAQDPKICV